MAVVPSRVVVIVEHDRRSGTDGHERQAVAEPVRVRGRPWHLPEHPFDQIPIRIRVLRPAEQEGANVWRRIP
jgi:hypothetical protein